MSVLQRMTLACGVALGTGGCFLSSPPDLAPPERTRPNLFDLTPANTGFIRLNADVAASFTARVQSEDAGVDLFALLYLNYDTPAQAAAPKKFARRPASTLDDTSRQISLSWTPELPADAGCQQVTMVVSHEDNFGGESGIEVLNANDVGLATWWVEVEGGSTVDVDDCPSNVGPQP